MKTPHPHRFLVITGLSLSLVAIAHAQTLLPLSEIAPGTEKVQLISNGDFQSPGLSGTNTSVQPVGWTKVADMSVGAGKNTVKADGGLVAVADISSNAPVCQFERKVTLLPDTEYVFSAYMWNMGDSDNNVIAVIDLNDAPDEPQVVLSSNEDNADQGYFVYNNFNTSTTGTNVTVRAFYESPSGKGAPAKYFPIAAQWDNIAITKAADFLAPKPKGADLAPAPAPATNAPATKK